MRLIDVVVDICFLSISRTKEFPQFGLNQISLIRFDESHVLIHQIPHRVSGRGEETYLFVCHLHRLREDGGLTWVQKNSCCDRCWRIDQVITS
jgi:hypothetical protein